MEGGKEDLGLSYLFLFPESGESSEFLLKRAAEKELDDQYQRLVKEALDDLRKEDKNTKKTKRQKDKKTKGHCYQQTGKTICMFCLKGCQMLGANGEHERPPNQTFN